MPYFPTAPSTRYANPMRLTRLGSDGTSLVWMTNTMTTPATPPAQDQPLSLAETPSDGSASPAPAAVVKSVCVFCGSSSRVDQRRKDEATALGHALAKAGLALVYGGGRVGLMGLVADAAMQGGTRVSGVIPRFLHDHEVAHTGVTDLEITDSMHDRKRRMY